MIACPSTASMNLLERWRFCTAAKSSDIIAKKMWRG
jgi:hypothetical protein